MSPKKIPTCVLYVRISLSTEESVSIERQIEAAQQYAAGRGWKVVGTFRDEGVSATHNKPEDRKGWQALVAARESYDAVVIWKVDRLARRVIDFLNANETVKARGAGIVAVEDPIDMTTAQGEAFAIMLAVFGQLEAATIRARVKAARDYLLRQGRYVGGGVPYGYRAVPNPMSGGPNSNRSRCSDGYRDRSPLPGEGLPVDGRPGPLPVAQRRRHPRRRPRLGHPRRLRPVSRRPRRPSHLDSPAHSVLVPTGRAGVRS